MILHTVNKSPSTHSALRDCGAIALTGDAVLLLEDGVYGAAQSTEGEQILQTLKEHRVSAYAIADDVMARGLSRNLSPIVELIDYDEFVALSLRHQSIQSWY